MSKNGSTTTELPVSLPCEADQVASRTDFLAFLQALVVNRRQNPDQWENRDLDTYLAAMAGWVQDMDGYYQQLREAPPDPPTWKSLAQMLMAARVYE